MIVLQDDKDTLQIVLAGAVTTNELPFYVAYEDSFLNTDTTENCSCSTPFQLNGTSNGTTAVDIAAPPTRSNNLIQKIRTVTYISIQNSDTAPAQVTIIFNANQTLRTLKVITLQPGDNIEFTSNGFNVTDSTGAVKTAPTTVANGWTDVVLGVDVVNADVVADTMADITGLEFPVVSGTYAFRALIQYSSAALTTGSRWGVNGSIASTLLGYRVFSATTKTIPACINANGYDDGLASASTANLDANTATIEGEITVVSSGIITMRFASEISASAITAKAGSILQWKKVL